MIREKERDHCIETQQKRVEVRGKKQREGGGTGWGKNTMEAVTVFKSHQKEQC